MRGGALLLVPLLLACAASGAACAVEDPAATASSPRVVVGVTSPAGATWAAGSRAGLSAALADANAVSRLDWALDWLDDAGDAARAADNARRLVCERGAFLVAAPAGSESSDAVARGLRALAGGSGAPVPLVGALSCARTLREASGGRAGVVNARAGGGDEMSAVAGFLARNWESLTRTAVFYRGTPYGAGARDYLVGALRSVNATPLAVVDVTALAGEADTAAAAAKCVQEMNTQVNAKQGTGAAIVPAAVVLVSTARLTGPLIAEMAASDLMGNVTFVCGSNIDPRDVYADLPAPARASLRSKHSGVYFQLPFPQPQPGSALPIVQDFLAAMNRTSNSSAWASDVYALEGYVVGRLVAMAATRALEIHGWPLTRATFLDAVFRTYRTFDLRGVALGPYGDGAAPQTADDWCNQGAHELYINQLDLETGALREAPSSSFRFAGCHALNWSVAERVLVGHAMPSAAEQSAADDMARLGLTAALAASNSARAAAARNLLVASARGPDARRNVNDLVRYGVVAVAASPSAAAGDARTELLSTAQRVPLVAPLSGAWALRWPFADNRNVVNVVPSAEQELATALRFVFRANASAGRVAVVLAADAPGYADALQRVRSHGVLTEAQNTALSLLSLAPSPNVTASSLAPEASADAFYFAGSTRAAAQFLVALERLVGSAAYAGRKKMLCSDVPQDLLVGELAAAGALGALAGVHLLSKTPPLAMLQSSSPLRQEYELWVSEVDRGESSFRGFFVGAFVSALVGAIDDGALGRAAAVTAETLVEVVYKKRTFDVGKFTVGPFSDQCTAATVVSCCNQGLDTVYVTAWLRDTSFALVPFDAGLGYCGSDFADHPAVPVPEKQEDQSLGLILALACGLGVCAVFIVGLVWLIYAHSKRTLSFLNIQKPELEINECIGQGRLGPLHVGDWHGTTVAIRVIEKKAITKAEQTAIKEEIGLLHKLHHPNLLMLMGYCETRNELYVVSEYMSGGSLKEYLARNRGQLGVFSLIAMAFDVVKGIAYLHASKPPIVHGSISTRSLLVDDKLTTKVSDFWYTGPARKASSSHSYPHMANRNDEWLAPEIAAGSVMTTATDVWAFGVVLWELFQSSSPDALPAPPALPVPSAGEGSATKSSSSSVQLEGLAQHPEPDASTPKEAVGLLSRCWEPQPGQRPSIFQVLCLWPSTFASIGEFEVPSDLSMALGATDDGSKTWAHDAAAAASMSLSEQPAVQSLRFELQQNASVASAVSMQSAGFCSPSVVAPTSATAVPPLSSLE
eukprot:m51a1_g2840 putative pas domain-containing protein tyrosine kinase (1266) ;mRNA; r:274216-278061